MNDCSKIGRVVPWHHYILYAYPKWIKRENIKIKTLPEKTEYTQNMGELDLTGGVLEAIYEDGTTESINLSETEVSGWDNSTKGKKCITVSYEGLTTQFNITVTDNERITDSKDNERIKDNER